MSSLEKLPVTVITGFLGSGKTTLISQLMQNPQGKRLAVVVNEFGEVVGAVTIDDILRGVLAPGHDDDLFGASTIQEIGPDHYRVSGTVSVRGLAKRLGIEVSGEGITTVAGYLQRHNERRPRPGDTAEMDRFQWTVLEQQDDGLLIEVVGRSAQGESDS